MFMLYLAAETTRTFSEDPGAGLRKNCIGLKVAARAAAIISFMYPRKLKIMWNNFVVQRNAKRN